MSRVSGIAAVTKSPNNAIKISAKSLSLPPAKASQPSPPRGAGLGASLGNFKVSIPVNLDKALYPFEIFTGMASTEPVIILSSEFIPLYSDSSGKKSKQGEAISLKEASKTLTTNASIAILFQSTGTNISPSSLIENNSQDLSAYVAAESGFIGQLMLKTNNAIDSMSISSFFLPSNISSFTFPFSSPAPSNQSHLPKSFYDILSSCGYKDIASFSETKLWQQTLIEIKRSLLSQSQSLSGQKPTRQVVTADTDSFLLSGVTSSNQKRIWLNPYQTTSELKAISSVSESLENFESIFNAFSNFDNRKYINIINANYTVPGDEPASSSSETVTDIGLISSILFKEAAYSSFLNNDDNKRKIQIKFGYDVSQSSVNFAVWDYIIGKFSISVLDSITTPLGLGNSLISLSQDTISTTDSGYYNVLTFEKSVIENYSITPGVHYYIDGAFNTSDGKTFDTSRLDYLISKTTSALETVNFIFDLSGYEIRNGRYKKKIIPLFSLDEMIKKLSIVSSMYQGCIAGDESSYQGSAFDTISQIMSDVARMINGDSGLDPRKISEISSSDNANIRLASVICKLTVSPSDSYKAIASKLKTYLFSLFMNKIVPNREPLNFPSHYVFSILSSVTANLDSSQLAGATLGLRTFPFTTDSFSGYEIVKESHVFEDDTFDRSSLDSASVQKYFDDNSILLKTNLDLDKGLWKEIFELMKSLYGSNMFLDENTSYSGLSRIAYMYSYFDLLMRVIADQTPENLMGAYTNTISGETEFQASGRNDILNDANNVGQLIGLADENEYRYQYSAKEHGLVLDRPNQAQIDEIYDPASASGSRSINKFNEAISSLKAEDDLITSQLFIVRNYILSLGNALSDFKTLLQNNFEAHVGKLNGLYKRDSSLTDKQRLALINMSFTEEQLRLSSYAMSEIKDRLSASGSGDVESKLKSMPAFSTLPSGFSKFLPVNETEIISYAMLSPYFKSSEFLNIKGNNMKIMSVGIPPKLNRSLRSSLSTASDNANGIKKSIIRIKVYKIDRLLPAVVYLPKTYLFEMNRFPTRIISNWDLASFSGNQTNLLSIPSKLMLPDSTVLLQKNFNEAFPDSIYSNMLTMQEKQQIYKNHSMSFLSEEYLRWFTDCRFDETRYNKFNNLDSSLTNIESQFQNFVDTVKKNSTTDTGQKVHASFVDPTSGQSYQIPVAIPPTSYISSESGQNQAVAQGQFILPMSDTIKAYFNHETLMSDPDIYKRRISYFKKFDRVFSLLIDPDDFYVDTSVTDPEALFSLAANETLVYQAEDDSYKHRDTTPLDTTLNEYFLTIEPYDYVQQSM